jgi:transcriptional regulator with XRE-family HTH domain
MAAFGTWLSSTMQTRGLTQAQVARAVGVADTQVSRWRRGQVVPTVHYLQRIADTFGVERGTLDQLVGYPVAQAPKRDDHAPDPAMEAELQAHHARLRDVMQRLPRSMWSSYVEACASLAEALSASVRLSEDPDAPHRPMGFKP